MEVRAAQTGAPSPSGLVADPLTAAELRVLKLLLTTIYLQIAATLYISYNTVKTQIRSIYQKPGVSSRASGPVHLCGGSLASSGRTSPGRTGGIPTATVGLPSASQRISLVSRACLTTYHPARIGLVVLLQTPAASRIIGLGCK